MSLTVEQPTKVHCSVGRCKAPTIARGLCTKHYQRWQAYRDTNDTAVCTKCRQRKALEEFPTSRAHPRGHFPWCKLCNVAHVAAWRKANPEKYRETSARARRQRTDAGLNRDARLKAVYGMTVADYERMYAEQGGACLICGTEAERLDIDHCHKTKKVRGLLCHTCNVGIGFLRDDPGLLLNAASYLGQHRGS